MAKFAKAGDKITAFILIIRIAIMIALPALIVLIFLNELFPNLTFALLCLGLVCGIGTPILLSVTARNKDRRDFQTLTSEKARLKSGLELEAITPSVEMMIEDEYFFERVGATMRISQPSESGQLYVASKYEKTGTLLLTDSRMIFASEVLSVLPYEQLGSVGYEPYKKTRSQIVVRFASLVNGDKYEILVPVADEELMRIYMGALVEGYRQRQRLGRVRLPYTNTCPRCAAPLKDGRCEFCGWTPPEMAL